MNGKKEYGDYQTPIFFTQKICSYLKNNLHISPSVVIEPTCGIGNFIQSSLIFEAEEYYGIEINKDYCDICSKRINDNRVNILNFDLFKISLSQLPIKNKSNILVIGNPPWVTNTTLSLFESSNVPIKSNFKGLRGIDAITGNSNFDICEYIILKLIHEYKKFDTVIAMICKTSVARNIFNELHRNNIPYVFCSMLEFDAKKIFGINASACIFVIKFQENETSNCVCNVYNFDNIEKIKSQFYYSSGRIRNIHNSVIEDFDGHCCFEWRQGVKHDCSKIMELNYNGSILTNNIDELVDIEDSIIYPLIKSSMFKNPIINTFSKYVIITQYKAGESTYRLQYEAPKAWIYLNKNIEFFRRRKSSIYNDSYPFSIFGIGEYSYSKYKVGISGFYKKPFFSLLYSDDSKPVMLDDTCYFICFDTYDLAYVAMILLNSVKVTDFLKGIIFHDAKRPYTKKILNRIDFTKITNSIVLDDMRTTEESLGLSSYIDMEMFNIFKDITTSGQMKLF